MKTEQQIIKILSETKNESNRIMKLLFNELNKDILLRDVGFCDNCFSIIKDNLTTIMILNKIINDFD